MSTDLSFQHIWLIDSWLRMPFCSNMDEFPAKLQIALKNSKTVQSFSGNSSIFEKTCVPYCHHCLCCRWCAPSWTWRRWGRRSTGGSRRRRRSLRTPGGNLTYGRSMFKDNVKSNACQPGRTMREPWTQCKHHLRQKPGQRQRHSGSRRNLRRFVDTIVSLLFFFWFFVLFFYDPR